MSIWLARDPMVVQRAKEYHWILDPVLAAEANSRFENALRKAGKSPNRSFLRTSKSIQIRKKPRTK